jgi:hypothetical protein
MIDIHRMPRWLRGVLLVMAAWAVTAVVGLVIVGQVTGSSPVSAGPARHGGGPANPAGPGWNVSLYPLGPPGSGAAEKTTVAGAQAAAGFPVPLPSTAAASRASLTQAWVSSSTLPRNERRVALVFDKGKVDITMARAQYKNPLSNFQAFIAQKSKNKVTAAIGRVNGRPALVITPDTSALCHCNPAYVEFDRNGIDINISSHTYGAHTLLAIARQVSIR